MTVTLYVAISSHGYGHIAQTAPVVNELCRHNPALTVVVECGWSRDVLASRLEMPFEHVPVSTDFGMVMKNALEVDIAASHARYVEAHSRLEHDVDACVRRLRDHHADLLLGNIPYVPLIAAKRLGVPAIAMCCLNWADIYAPLCAGMPGSDAIHREMVSAYRAADRFLAPQPAMPMPAVADVTRIGPIGRVSSSVRDELRTRRRFKRLVLVTMGGIETQLDFARWPKIEGVLWAVSDGTQVQRDDMIRHSDFGMPFIDLLASSDAIIAKPGYGTFVEAACNDVPVLYVPRSAWPEAPYIIEWLSQHARCLEVPMERLISSCLSEDLETLLSQAARPPAIPTGIGEAVDIMGPMLTSRRTGDSKHRAGSHG